MSLILGQATPMVHQAEDVERLHLHPRINVWNGLGTGKTCTVAWWLQRQWMKGMIDEAVVVLPSMCARDWELTLCGLAWPDGMVDFYDCRPPDTDWLFEMLTDGYRPLTGRFRVMVTTYASMRKLLAQREGTSRWKVPMEQELLKHVRGRRIAAVYDEAQAAALQTSAQGSACRAFASCCTAVASITATPIGNPLQMRLWGMTQLVRPDILMRYEPDWISGGKKAKRSGKRGSFNAFKYRYAHLRDPQEDKRGFSMHRSYPVSIYQKKLEREILKPMAPFTCRRRKQDCLDLPPKVYMTRYVRLGKKAERMMRDLIEDDRAILDDGRAVVPDNILEEKLRTLELTGGWLAGEPVHTDKLAVLRDVFGEIDEAYGERAPVVVWCSRVRELLAAAMVAAREKPAEAQRRASLAQPSESTLDGKAYQSIVRFCEKRGVGIIHGPTGTRDRDRVQELWKAGKLRSVVAHPGVAGAGLNWQHVKATVYYSPPIGTISRQQSEDRVHRKGLTHDAVYYDLVVEGGPDEAVVAAHRDQKNAATAMLNWLLGHIR